MLTAPPLAAQPVAMPSANPAPAMLPAGTPVFVSVDQDLTTTNSIGDIFQVTVLRDVVDAGTIVIPRGTIGHGEVTYLGKRGGFGRAGLISIALRDLDLGQRRVALDGIYREQGKSKIDETAVTWFMIGVIAGTIKGKDTTIPKGRELKAWTHQGLAYIPGAAPPPVFDRSPESAGHADAAPAIAAAPTPMPTATDSSRAISVATTTSDSRGSMK